MAVRLNLTYSDGTTESVAIRPLGLVAAERIYGAGTTGGRQIESTLYAAWFLKGKPSGSLDAWLETIEDVEEKSEDVRPLEEAPSPEASPTSQ